MSLFKKFVADMSDQMASNFDRMSRDRRLTPEQREEVREKANNWRNLGNSMSDDD